MSRESLTIGFIAIAILSSGCTTKAPTIAHVHIGHTITGWRETPNEEGLLITAEAAAEDALDSAKRAASPGNDLPTTKEAVRDVLQAVDPATSLENSSGAGFGLKRAVETAISHLEFARDSDDASSNVRQSVPRILKRATTIVERSDQILVFGDAVLNSSSRRESSAIAKEILALSRINLYGNDNDYGLAQFRRNIKAMIDREDPPYTTVDTWYLLNLVRLPSGKWGFSETWPSGAGYMNTGYGGGS